MEDIDNYSSEEEYGDSSLFNTINEIDSNQFYKNYKEMKKTYKTSKYLSKYEKTRIISERVQQLANGSTSYLKNPESYSSIYDIAIAELNQKKLPFILKRIVSSEIIEFWKLEELQF